MSLILFFSIAGGESGDTTCRFFAKIDAEASLDEIQTLVLDKGKLIFTIHMNTTIRFIFIFNFFNTSYCCFFVN